VDRQEIPDSVQAMNAELRVKPEETHAG